MRKGRSTSSRSYSIHTVLNDSKGRPNELDILGVPAVTCLHKCSCACQPSSVRSSTMTHLNIELETRLYEKLDLLIYQAHCMTQRTRHHGPNTGNNFPWQHNCQLEIRNYWTVFLSRANTKKSINSKVVAISRPSRYLTLLRFTVTL